VGNPQPLENFYVWSKKVVHTQFPKKKKQNKTTILTTRINVGLMGICSNCHMHEKLQEQKLSQKHSKENKSQ